MNFEQRKCTNMEMLFTIWSRIYRGIRTVQQFTHYIRYVFEIRHGAPTVHTRKYTEKLVDSLVMFNFGRIILKENFLKFTNEIIDSECTEECFFFLTQLHIHDKPVLLLVLQILNLLIFVLPKCQSIPSLAFLAVVLITILSDLHSGRPTILTLNKCNKIDVVGFFFF